MRRRESFTVGTRNVVRTAGPAAGRAWLVLVAAGLAAVLLLSAVACHAPLPCRRHPVPTVRCAR